MAHRGFWRELKRRNVPRAAVLYAGAMWLLAQVITQLGPVLNAPAWIARAFLIAVAVGFPFWIALAKSSAKSYRVGSSLGRTRSRPIFGISQI